MKYQNVVDMCVGMFSSLVLAVAALAGFSDSAELPEYRLKGDVVPSHYILEIYTDLDNFTFQGKVWIKVRSF